MKRFSVLLAGVASLAIAATAFAAPALRSFGTGDVTLGSTVTIVNEAGEYGGVYLKSKSQSGKYLADVSFGFTNEGDVAGGAPRFSWPIDTDENGSVDGYAFLDVNNCGSNWVSTENDACVVWFGSDSYANWDAFAAANPMYRSAPGAIPFIIADWVGSYAVTDIDLR